MNTSTPATLSALSTLVSQLAYFTGELQVAVPRGEQKIARGRFHFGTADHNITLEWTVTPVDPGTFQESAYFFNGTWNVWDQVTINGRECGNRHGGQKELVRLCNEVIERVLRAEMTPAPAVAA